MDAFLGSMQWWLGFVGNAILMVAAGLCALLVARITRLLASRQADGLKAGDLLEPT